ncbi:hypothetical protein R1sor_007799 [Riccia sorocarpa]|uniref:Uncharacterized protein n=1 Tax=Riccia sorocarpa TaxID=122646 RepID=A0ABD3HRV7_9MARC
MDNAEARGRISDSQNVNIGRPNENPHVGEAHENPQAGEAGASSDAGGLVSALGGQENFKMLLTLITESIKQAALSTGNTLLEKFAEFRNQPPLSHGGTPFGMQTVDGSNSGTPVSGQSTPPVVTPPPGKGMKLEWNSELLSLPNEQNNHVNAKVRLVAERHFKKLDHWKDQPTEKKQECIMELRQYYRNTEQIPDSFFRDKFSAWGRNRRQYLNKNICSVTGGNKSVDELRKICSEELQTELEKLSQSEGVEKIREAQRKKQEKNNVHIHHFGTGGRRLFKEDFIAGLQSQLAELKDQLQKEKSKKSGTKRLKVSDPGSPHDICEPFVDDEAQEEEEEAEEEANEEDEEAAEEETEEENEPEPEQFKNLRKKRPASAVVKPPRPTSRQKKPVRRQSTRKR